ncbi:MAG: hypothetical protein WC511_00700 [Candidatus Pacearchaeota archaeon]|jgi:hypothetical protein
MNEYFSNLKLKRKRLASEEQDSLDKMSTDYCRGYNSDEREIESVAQEIYRNGEIGGHRL